MLVKLAVFMVAKLLKDLPITNCSWLQGVFHKVLYAQDFSYRPDSNSSYGNCEDEVDMKRQQSIFLSRFKTPAQSPMSPQGAEQR